MDIEKGLTGSSAQPGASPVHPEAGDTNVSTRTPASGYTAWRVAAWLTLMLCPGFGRAVAGEPLNPPRLELQSPLDYEVRQRQTRTEGVMAVAGSLPQGFSGDGVIEARLIGSGAKAAWEPLTNVQHHQAGFRTDWRAPAGGWYRLEVRLRQGDAVLAEGVVAHVGVGEVFVIAGQSNAANHGEEKQATTTGLVAAFSGTGWKPANDPQPGASGEGGSFVPSFGDAMAKRFRVPIGIIAVGVGATSVREWLPRGTRFPNPPTLTGHVAALPSGEWESKGTLFDRLQRRVKQAGPRGFRAVLWHQGESDANQQDPTRTLPGDLYKKFLTQLIRETRREAGWECPWFVALVSYHTPDDAGSEEIRAGQRSVWTSGLALEGPDSDALRGEWRDGGGKGVHFSGKGLREHGARWADKVAAWLEPQLAQVGSARNPAPASKAAPAYGLSAAELEARVDDFNPIARVGLLARAKVPVVIIHDIDQDSPNFSFPLAFGS